MRKILNILALGLVIAGVMLNKCDLMGGSIVLILATVTLLLSLGLFAIKDNKEAGLSNWLNYLLVGIISLLIIGTTMKSQHCGGFHFLIMAGFALLPIALIALIFQKDEVKISKQFFITSIVFFIFLLGTVSSQLFCADQCEVGNAKTEACCDKGAVKNDACKQGNAKMDACKKGGADKEKCCDKGAAKMGACKKDGSGKGDCPKGECTPGQCAQKGECPKQGECKMEDAKKESCCKKGEGNKDCSMTKDHCAK